MTGSYTDQFNRCKRSLGKCRDLYATSGHSGMLWDTVPEQRDDALDSFYHLFTDLYNLKDWLKNDPAVPKHVKDQVESFVEGDFDLRLLADVANAIKHLQLGARKNHKVRVSKDVSAEIVTLLSGPMGTFPFGGFYGYAINIKTGTVGQDAEALQFALNCIAKWESFFDNNSLPR